MEQVVECTVILDCKYELGYRTLGEVGRAFSKMVEETLSSNPDVRIEHKPKVHVGEMTYKQL